MRNEQALPITLKVRYCFDASTFANERTFLSYTQTEYSNEITMLF